MCTSFAAYFDQPVYGMNFDFADVELKWRMASDEGRQAYRSVFYLCFELDGAFTEVAGVNDRGLFGAGQILVADFEIVPHSQDVLVSPYQVFVGALRKGCRVDDVLDLIGDRRLAYTTDAKGHQLYADRFGSAIVVEPGRAGNEIGRSEVGFVVMTNFANWQARGQEAAEWSGLGADRYRTACQFIAGHRGHFGIAEGMEVLKRTALLAGAFTTQCSMLCDPAHGAVYVTVRRDFERVWKVDLAQRDMETLTGFRDRARFSLLGDGVPASCLAACA